MSYTYRQPGDNVFSYSVIADIFLLLVIATCFYLSYNPPIDVSEEFRTWSFAHIILHSIPIYLYLKNFHKHATNFPFVETLAAFNIIHFGLPALFIKLNDFQLGTLRPVAIEVVFWAYIIFYLSYYYFRSNLRTKPIEFIPSGTSLFYLKYYAYILLGIYILSKFVDDSTIYHLGNVGIYIYVGFCINFWKDKLLTPLEKAIFIPVLLNDILNRATEGLIAPVALLLFYISLCIIISKSKKFFIIIGIALFIWFYSIFSSVKFEYRTTLWYGSQTYSLFDRFNLIGNLYEENRKSNAIEYVDKYKGKDQFLWRFSYELSAISMVLEKTPAKVPYWNGESYLPLLTKFIPRLIWSDKPTENMGKLFGVRYGVISVFNTRTSINAPIIPEFYINFGYGGIYLGCLFLGFFFAFLSRLFNSNAVSYSSKIIGMAIIFPLVIWESNFSLIFGDLILVSFFVIILFKVILSLVKK